MRNPLGAPKLARPKLEGSIAVGDDRRVGFAEFGDPQGRPVFWLHGTASKRCCELKGGPYLEPKFFGDGMAIAVPKTDAQIKSMLNGALAKLRADGRLEEITERYFPVKIF